MPKSIIYTQAFKTAVLGQLKKGHTVAEVAKAFGLHTAAIYRWMQEAEQAAKKTTPAQESNPDVSAAS